MGKERPEPLGAPSLVPAARLTISPEIRYRYLRGYGTISLEITRSLLYLISSLTLSISILIDTGSEQNSLPADAHRYNVGYLGLLRRPHFIQTRSAFRLALLPVRVVAAIICGIMIPHRWRARRSLKFMPKRGIDAASRFFFDELLSLDAARLTATGAIRLEDRHGVIAFGDEDHGVNAANASASPIRNSRTAARGAISFVPDAAAGKRSSGSSMMRRAA